MADPDTQWTPRARLNTTSWETQNLTLQTTDEMTTLMTEELGPALPNTVWTNRP